MPQLYEELADHLASECANVSSSTSDADWYREQSAWLKEQLDRQQQSNSSSTVEGVEDRNDGTLESAVPEDGVAGHSAELNGNDDKQVAAEQVGTERSEAQSVPAPVVTADGDTTGESESFAPRDDTTTSSIDESNTNPENEGDDDQVGTQIETSQTTSPPLVNPTPIPAPSIQSSKSTSIKRREKTELDRLYPSSSDDENQQPASASKKTKPNFDWPDLTGPMVAFLLDTLTLKSAERRLLLKQASEEGIDISSFDEANQETLQEKEGNPAGRPGALRRKIAYHLPKWEKHKAELQERE